MPWKTSCCVGVWSWIFQRLMRAFVVIPFYPIFGFLLSLCDALKNVCIKDVFAKCAIEPFYYSILCRLTGLIAYVLNSFLMHPQRKAFTAEFRAIVGSDWLGFAIQFNYSFQRFNYFKAWQTKVHKNAKAFPVMMSNNIESADSSFFIKTIMKTPLKPLCPKLHSEFVVIHEGTSLVSIELKSLSRINLYFASLMFHHNLIFLDLFYDKFA